MVKFLKNILKKKKKINSRSKEYSINKKIKDIEDVEKNSNSFNIQNINNSMMKNHL